MIASIRGKILRINMNSVHIETPIGIGYEVLIPFPVHLELKKNNNTLEFFLYIYHSKTDRGERLFGFLTYKDKELFQLMKSMNGIGELTALKILSFFNGESLYRIAIEDNKQLLEKIPKIKGKTSEKILFELKQNLKKIESFLVPDDTESEIVMIRNNESAVQLSEINSIDELSNNQKDLAVLGLIQLGFDEKTAKKEVDKFWNQGTKEASEIINKILKSL